VYAVTRTLRIVAPVLLVSSLLAIALPSGAATTDPTPTPTQSTGLPPEFQVYTLAQALESVVDARAEIAPSTNKKLANPNHYVVALAAGQLLRARASHGGWDLSGVSKALSKSVVCLDLGTTTNANEGIALEPCTKRTPGATVAHRAAEALSKASMSVATAQAANPNTLALGLSYEALTTNDNLKYGEASYSAGGWDVYAGDAFACLTLPSTATGTPTITSGSCATQTLPPLSALVLAQSLAYAANALSASTSVPFFEMAEDLSEVDGLPVISDPYDQVVWAAYGSDSTYACVSAPLGSEVSASTLSGPCTLSSTDASSLLTTVATTVAEEAEQTASTTSPESDPNLDVPGILTASEQTGAVSAISSPAGWTITMGPAFSSPDAVCLSLPASPSQPYTLSPQACAAS
jgi:hypothetical protein